MIAIPNMEKPKKGEVIAFDSEYAVYTDDNMQVHRYPLIEIDLVRCGECKYWESAKNGWNGYCENKVDAFNTFYANDFCSFGERRADGNKRRSV